MRAKKASKPGFTPGNVSVLQRTLGEMRNGVSAVCATCDRYWEGKRLCLPKCTALSACGSPLAGDTFTHYQGPLTPEAFIAFCFVCGAASLSVIRVGSKARRIGVCDDHVRLLRTHAVQQEAALLSPLELSFGNGWSTLDQLYGPRRKSFLESVAEVERSEKKITEI